MPYNHQEIEKKWQEKWAKSDVFQARDNSEKEKFFCLVEFPYPSGAGLHVGHVRTYTGLDIIARKKRMEGKNVLFPIGWDAFGLPTENFAIKTGRTPQNITKENTDNYRCQMKALGLSFDWSREINTTDPAYYRWTQWMFLQFFKNGLAYKKKMSINWCLSCKIGLANEEVVVGKCERCGGLVEKRDKEQWMMAITKYADRLLEDLKTVDYLPKIKKQQADWIGKSEGAEVAFRISHSPVATTVFDTSDRLEANRKAGEGLACPAEVQRRRGVGAEITVFTTRPDTLFGATYLVLSPEHSLVSEITTPEQKSAVEEYVSVAKNKTAIERGDDTREKTGVFTGAYAINPVNNEQIPIWVADYVLAGYGTGVIMAVPAHDERDFAFAQKFNLPIKQVVVPVRIDSKNPPVADKLTVTRQTIHGLVIDPKTGKILCLKWKQQPWTGFVVGGVDEGEDIVVAARREIKEETGYVNLKFIRVLGGVVRGEYFAAHKDENRIAYSNAILFELENDERDIVGAEEFAKHEAIWLEPKTLNHDNFTCAELDLWFKRLNDGEAADCEYGVAINSEFLNDLPTWKAKDDMTSWLEEKGFGRRHTQYKLRDWIFSRQRYWGEPIPLVSCEKCGWVPVPDKDLPLILPEVKNYQPTDNGESPLATIADWVETKCPTCGEPAKRETDTMPNWAGSSWYFLRYADPKNNEIFASPEKLKYWMPVDLYNGGMEHTTLHLLYSRFWNKFLFDQGFVPTSEPYVRRHSHGLILASDSNKMSKSRGNVVNPDDIVNEYGADTLRTYEAFIGPFEEPVPWNENGLVGVRRFLEKVNGLVQLVTEKENENVTRALHQTIKKVGDDINDFRFNTAVSQMMTFVNTVSEEQGITRDSFLNFLRALCPFAPHLTNEIAAGLGETEILETGEWPVYDPEMLKSDEVTLAIQVNGKLRGTITVPNEASEEEVKTTAMAEENVKKNLEGKEIVKVIFVKGKLMNFVVR